MHLGLRLPGKFQELVTFSLRLHVVFLKSLRVHTEIFLSLQHARGHGPAGAFLDPWGLA
jgi:hypothetical protein